MKMFQGVFRTKVDEKTYFGSDSYHVFFVFHVEYLRVLIKFEGITFVRNLLQKVRRCGFSR